MASVSEGFQKAIDSNTRVYHWLGEVHAMGGAYNFGSEDIIKGSGYLKRQICGGSEIELGTVYAAELGLTLRSSAVPVRYSLDGAVIKLYFGLHFEREGGWGETVLMGTFDVAQANRKAKTVEIKAYDRMLRFEKPLSLSISSGTAYLYLKEACDACGVELAQSYEEIAALPNGSSTVSIYPDNDMETYRDLLYYISQMLGCFCQIDREGRLVLRAYGDTPDWEIPPSQRYESEYSDFVTRYTAVSLTNISERAEERQALEEDDGLTMSLGANPFMQSGLVTARGIMLRKLLTAVTKINYVPFESETIGNPAMDPGDILRFTGGHADETKISCITDMEYRINGKVRLKCVGQNPKLSGVKTKEEKNLSGLQSSVGNGKYTSTRYRNEQAYTIGKDPVEVLSADFTASEDTSAVFQCETLLEIQNSDLEIASELTVLYALNDEPYSDFTPKKTCMPGRHILTLYFPIPKTVPNSLNTFSVSLSVSEGSAEVGAGQIRATIGGVGLAASAGEWNGRINITEVRGQVSLSGEGIAIDRFLDEKAVTLPDLHKRMADDTFGFVSIRGDTIAVDTFAEELDFAQGDEENANGTDQN